VVVWTLPTGTVVPPNRQSPESGVVHDHVRLSQHQIAAIACIAVSIGSWHIEHTGVTQRGETVGGSSEIPGLGCQPPSASD
jgi:hypothetical protein